MKTANDLTIEVKGTFQSRKNDDYASFEKIQMIEKASDQLKLVGIALNKYYGRPIFEIEGKTYLLKKYSIKENCAVLTFFMPEDLEYWQSAYEFFSTEIL